MAKVTKVEWGGAAPEVSLGVMEIRKSQQLKPCNINVAIRYVSCIMHKISVLCMYRVSPLNNSPLLFLSGLLNIQFSLFQSHIISKSFHIRLIELEMKEFWDKITLRQQKVVTNKPKIIEMGHCFGHPVWPLRITSMNSETVLNEDFWLKIIFFKLNIFSFKGPAEFGLWYV